MDFKNNPLRSALLIALGLILIVLLWSTFSTSGENKRLKRAINENLLKIEQLETEKNIIFESIERDSLLLLAKDAIILDLSKKSDSLSKNLKTLNYERTKIQNAYLSNDVNKRVALFAELASKTDSIR